MIYFIIACLIVLADQIVKFLISSNFAAGGQLDLIPGILRITYVSNTGGAFSILSDHTLLLAIVSAVVCLLIVFLIIKGKLSVLGKLSLGFILGGAIGNLIDRFFIGHVVDMFQPLFIDFAVFNVADIFITVGAVMFIIYIIFFWRPGKSKKHEDELDFSPEVSDLAPSPAPAFPEKPDHKMNSKERREYKKARKYGPDIDESTVHIPVDQIKTALGDKMTDDTIVISKESDPEKDAPAHMDIPDFKPSADTSDAEGKHEFTLEEIMREYGHDS